MLTNLPSDFTDTRYRITVIDSAKKVYTNIPFILADDVNLVLVDEQNNIISEDIIASDPIDEEGMTAFFINDSFIDKYPDGNYYLVPEVKGSLSANRVLIYSAGEKLNASASHFDKSTYTVYTIGSPKSVDIKFTLLSKHGGGLQVSLETLSATIERISDNGYEAPTEYLIPTPISYDKTTGKGVFRITTTPEAELAAYLFKIDHPILSFEGLQFPKIIVAEDSSKVLNVSASAFSTSGDKTVAVKTH